MISFSCLSSIAIGLYVTYSAMLTDNEYASTVNMILRFFLSLGSLSSNGNEEIVNKVILICLIVLLVAWFVFYVTFVFMYNRNKAFYSFIVYAILYIGFYGFTITSVWAGTVCGFFVKYLLDSSKADYFAYLGLASYISFMYASYYMDRIYQSSPDVDTVDRFSFWPQNILPRVYKTLSKYVMPLLLEFFRDTDYFYVALILNIIICAFGVFVLLKSETTVYPSGKVTLTSEYFTIIISHLYVIIYRYSGINCLLCLLIDIVTCAIAIVVLAVLVQRQSKINIDLLYSKFENLVSNINTPQQCITIIKLGIVYNAPCISNHTLLNWTISRWPNNQELQLLVAFIFYLLKMKYKEILDIVSACVDLAPLSSYNSLLFYQIFNRLPTNEVELVKRIEYIKRLYEIPKISLKSFWESILAFHYDEAARQCLIYHNNLEQINQVFVNLIFENPSSDCVLEEYIKFNNEIMGNKIAAGATESRMMKMKNPVDELPENAGESMAQLSRLSSVKSSVFISEFSENGEDIDKTKHGVQSAINARPLYWPTRFFVAVILVSLVSLISCIVVFVVAENRKDRLYSQVDLGLYYHRIQHTVTKLVMYTLQFPTHDATHKVDPDKDIETVRKELNELTNYFDEVISQSFQLYENAPLTLLNSWATKKANASVLSPTSPEYKNVSYIEEMRLFQLNCRTISLTDSENLGDVENPSDEIRQVVLFYPTLARLLTDQIEELEKIIEDEKGPDELTIILIFVIGVSISVVFMLVALPLIIVQVTKEFKFIVSIYATVPMKTINTILNKNENHDDFIAFRDTNESHQKISPRESKIYGITILSLTAVLIIPIPMVFIVTQFIEKNNDAVFIINSIKVSADMIASLGYLYLYSYQKVSKFMETESPVTDDKFRTETKNIFTRYHNLLFGENVYDDSAGYIYKSSYQTYITKEKCTALSYGKVPNTNCIKLGTSIAFLYLHCYRLIDMTDDERPTDFDSHWWEHFYEVGNDMIETLSLEFFNISTTMTDTLNESSYGFNGLGLMISVILFLVEIISSYLFMKITLTPSLRALLDPILVMDLGAISESPQMVKFLQGDFDKSFRSTAIVNMQKEQTVVASINDFIADGILAVNSDGVVIGSNKRYHELTSSSPIDIIGHPISDILPPAAAPLLETIDTIFRKSASSTARESAVSAPQNELVMQLDISLFTGDEREVPVSIKLVTNKQENTGKNVQCALVITDRTKMISQQQTIEQAKQKISNIIETLVPRQVFVPFNGGKRDIFIDVPQATILVAYAVNYSDSISGMPAKQSINALNLFFKEFDTELSAFPTLTKIHSFGERYCVVSGIFEGDGTPQQAALNVVSFGKKLIQSAQMVSNVNSHRLRFRVGIHTGGPLQCIVLGGEVPSFEIVGHPLTIAQALERTGKVDNVHISQETSEMIQEAGMTLILHKGNIPEYSNQTYLIQNV